MGPLREVKDARTRKRVGYRRRSAMSAPIARCTRQESKVGYEPGGRLAQAVQKSKIPKPFGRSTCAGIPTVVAIQSRNGAGISFVGTPTEAAWSAVPPVVYGHFTNASRSEFP